MPEILACGIWGCGDPVGFGRYIAAAGIVIAAALLIYAILGNFDDDGEL